MTHKQNPKWNWERKDCNIKYSDTKYNIYNSNTRVNVKEMERNTEKKLRENIARNRSNIEEFERQGGNDGT